MLFHHEVGENRVSCMSTANWAVRLLTIIWDKFGRPLQHQSGRRQHIVSLKVWETSRHPSGQTVSSVARSLEFNSPIAT